MTVILAQTRFRILSETILSRRGSASNWAGYDCCYQPLQIAVVGEKSEFLKAVRFS